MTFLGTIVFARDEQTCSCTSSPWLNIELHDWGIGVASARDRMLIPWEAVREMRGWSPVSREDRGRPSPRQERR